MYNNQLQVPTCWIGPGTLSVAHSDKEQIAVDDVLKGVEVLYRFVCGWCG
jgi:acetylornithine deacetylase/succinyl-diaminopimelate desuccinylase-like protein